MTRSALAVVVALVPFLTGCGSLRAMTAPSSDLADYRAFRVAAADGTRLARAQRYLERHPGGVFAGEVSRAFASEEPVFFERAKTSRSGAVEYLTDLPHGPHAAAALALVNALEQDAHEAELRDLVARARGDEVRMEAAAQQRRAVGETILGAVGVLLDEDTYATPLSAAAPALRALLVGPAPATWGRLPAAREQDLFFSLPTRDVRESRLLTLTIAFEEQGGRVVEGRISGPAMFVRWAEADRMIALDPSLAEDRMEGHAHAMERLDGALERRFPAATCPDAREGNELYRRSCGGFSVRIAAGADASEPDIIVVRGVPGVRGSSGAGRSGHPADADRDTSVASKTDRTEPQSR